MKSLLLCTINNVPSEIKEETIGLSLTVWVFGFVFLREYMVCVCVSVFALYSKHIHCLSKHIRP